MAQRSPTLTTTDLARVIDRTPAWVRKLTSDGVIQRARDADGNEIMGRYTLLAVRDYCRWMHSAQRLDQASEMRRNALRNEKLAAENELVQLRLQEVRAELHQGRHIEFIWTNMLTHFKQRILAIPARTARRCVGKKFREIFKILTEEIHLALQELSEYSRAMFAEQREAYLKSQGVDLKALNGENGDTEAERK